MTNRYNTEGIFGDVVALDDNVHRRYSGKDYIATDDLEKEGNHSEVRLQGILKLLAVNPSQYGHHWVYQKPQMAAGGAPGSRNLVTDPGEYGGVSSAYDYAVIFNETSLGWDDIPFDDDSASDYYVEALPSEVPTEVSVGRDGLLRYSKWDRVVGFANMGAGTGENNNNLVQWPGGFLGVTEPVPGTLEFDVTFLIGGAWAVAGSGSRTRPVVIWKQSAAELDDNRGPMTQDGLVAIYQGLAVSDGVTVTVTVPHTFGQGGTPSLVGVDYTCVVLGPRVSTARKFSSSSLTFARFDAATGTFSYDDVFTAPNQKVFAGIWTAIDMKPVGGHVVWDPAVLTAWSFQTSFVWKTDQTGKSLYLSFAPWPLGLEGGAAHAVYIRKVRIRANTDVTGDFVEVTLSRGDFNSANFTMDSGAPRQFDNVTTELTIVPDLKFDFVANPASIGADSQFLMLKIESNGVNGTVYTLHGIDVLWELCEE